MKISQLKGFAVILLMSALGLMAVVTHISAAPVDNEKVMVEITPGGKRITVLRQHPVDKTWNVVSMVDSLDRAGTVIKGVNIQANTGKQVGVAYFDPNAYNPPMENPYTQ